jgi:hypothetical protein
MVHLASLFRALIFTILWIYFLVVLFGTSFFRTQAAIDLDLQEIQTQLALGTDQSFAIAQDIYETGAFSQSVAILSLTVPLTVPIAKGAAVSGLGDGGEVIGTILEDYKIGTQVIQVEYATSFIQSAYSRCQVGANPNPTNMEGCEL